MHYTCELEDGRKLHVGNEGNHTSVTLSSGGAGQQQSQATGFDTGEWAEPPALYRLQHDLILQLTTSEGAQFLHVRGNQIQRSTREPDLAEGKKLSLEKSAKPAGLEPMRPMEPMKPMRPMEPMKPMRPMEM